MSLEKLIEDLTEAIKTNTAVTVRHTDLLETLNLNRVDTEVEEPKPEPETATKKKKPIAAKKSKPIKKKEPEPAPVNTSKPPITFQQLTAKVIKWIGPLAKNPDTEEEAQEIMQKLLDKFAGGGLFKVENIKPEHYQNILDYIEETKLDY